MGDTITLPRSDDRTVILGKTGSGKTCAAVWVLSLMDFNIRPWVILDYKGDELINGITRAEYITYDVLPDTAGIYILRVLPGDEDLLSDWFRRVWEQGGIGIYVDEGYMIDRHDKYFNACLTQGRSKEIPMIILSQRPVYLSRFVFSEASYIMYFGLNDDRDIDTVARFLKTDERKKLYEKMPRYHSRYYSVADDSFKLVGPVPTGDTILEKIDSKIPRKRRLL